MSSLGPSRWELPELALAPEGLRVLGSPGGLSPAWGQGCATAQGSESPSTGLSCSRAGHSSWQGRVMLGIAPPKCLMGTQDGLQRESWDKTIMGWFGLGGP